MKLLQKLPGSRRYPAGWEWWMLKKLPLALLASAVIPLVWYLLAHWFPVVEPGQTVEKHLIGVRIAAIATVITAWTAVFTIAIGCCIVVLMKGPAHVADRYPLVDADEPRATAPKRQDAAESRD